MINSNKKKIRIGYMPSFNGKLLDEIKFARRHFDFIEITLEKNLMKYTKKYLKQIKKSLDNFEVLGHIHWDIDLTKSKGVTKVLKIIKIYNFFRAKKITIHPYVNNKLTERQILLKNLKLLKRISDFCKKKQIQLLIENSEMAPFNNVANLKYLIEKIPFLGVTLDIGHANILRFNMWQKYLKEFGSKIRHVHIHFNKEENDHLPFTDKTLLNDIFNKLTKRKYIPSVTLEIFYILQKRQRIPIDGTQRRRIILFHLETIKKSGFR